MPITHVVILLLQLSKIEKEPRTRVLLLAVVNLSHVPVERVLGAEDDFAVAAVELLGAFVNLGVKCCLLVMLRALIRV